MGVNDNVMFGTGGWLFNQGFIKNQIIDVLRGIRHHIGLYRAIELGSCVATKYINLFYGKHNWLLIVTGIESWNYGFL